MPKPTTQHRSQAPITCIKVLSPALESWQVALILGTTERTVRRWRNFLTTQKFGRLIRYPAKENGLTSYIEVVSDPADATPHP
ncbi:hypothetical protein SAMN05192529_13116 [Arachidicoccus rhizosphaerae]|uniref:Uncharacterized protein n=1 Tax=Arachidicoccus rhizosphaerae TaxID=551991 RepID=A0A1H4CF24_9BACT|nr:DNA-binding protein [Arachidicoccus rhizosphaerae]SEA58954.1 hypothetical protein SAMN05192529_13116 [Arachidicoccus rhizosphaerae]